MTNTPRPDRAPKRDESPKATGEKSPFEKMRDLTRRIVRVPKAEVKPGKSPRRLPPN